MTRYEYIIITRDQKEPARLGVNLVKKVQKSESEKISGKLMAIVFSECRGVLLAHYVPKGVNVNSVYYRKIFCELKVNICHKLSDLKNEQIFFIHDNATHILLISQRYSSTSLTGSFFRIWLIRQIWYPVIFGYSCTAKISAMASILRMIYR